MTQQSIIPLRRLRILLVVVLVAGGTLRLTGINWDEGHHLQPDERYISMVLDGLRTPRSLSQYLDTERSPLSPYLTGNVNYIYGQLPLSLIKMLAVALGMDGYGRSYVFGRGLSALLDTATIFLVYLVGKKLFNRLVGFFAASAYALIPLSIQYSHFMVMESWSVFFWMIVMLALLWWRTRPWNLARIVLLGVSLGAALAVKATSVFLAGLVGFSGALLALPVAALSFRFFSPTIFEKSSWFNWALRPSLQQALSFQRDAMRGIAIFPPSWQWAGTTPLWFPAKNLFLWGVGVTLSLLMLIGIGVALVRAMRKRQYFLGFLIAFVVGSFVYNGVQFVKTMRYLLPFFGLLAVFGGVGADWLIQRWKSVGAAIVGVSFIWAFVFAVMFASIYRKPTTRVSASEWIYQNIPPGDTIALEEWDDPIPLGIGEKNLGMYDAFQMQVYALNDDANRPLLDQWIDRSDWIILSSYRAKGTIGKLPDQFPLVVKFYAQLEDGSLGFQLAQRFTSFPSLSFGPLGELQFDDSGAEEAFWVYDHPVVEIYRRQRRR